MTATIQLSHPRQLGPSIHAEILQKLRKSLEELKLLPQAQEAGLAPFRVRDWWLILQDGRGCLEIYLDKGYSPKNPTEGVQPGEVADGAILLDQCQVVHEHLLSTDALSEFDDEIAIQVGSPGLEPPLRDLVDFVASVGIMVDVTTWSKESGREKFVMILSEVKEREGAPLLVLKEGPHVFDIPLANVKFALALPEHPFSLGKPAKSKSKSGSNASPKKSKQKR